MHIYALCLTFTTTAEEVKHSSFLIVLLFFNWKEEKAPKHNIGGKLKIGYLSGKIPIRSQLTKFHHFVMLLSSITMRSKKKHQLFAERHQPTNLRYHHTWYRFGKIHSNGMQLQLNHAVFSSSSPNRHLSIQKNPIRFPFFFATEDADHAFGFGIAVHPRGVKKAKNLVGKWWPSWFDSSSPSHPQFSGIMYQKAFRILKNLLHHRSSNRPTDRTLWKAYFGFVEWMIAGDSRWNFILIVKRWIFKNVG